MKIFNHEFRFFKYGIFTSEDNKTILLRLYGGSEWGWDGEGYAKKIDSRLKDYPAKQECEIIIMQDKTNCGFLPLKTTALIKTLKQNFPNLKTIVHEDWDYDFDTGETLRILKPNDIIDLALDLQRKKKDYASAEAYYKLAYELARFGLGETWAGLWLGMLYVEQNKNLREAEELLKERANSDEDVGGGKVEYGKLLLKQGKIDEAWDMFLKAVCGYSDTQPREIAHEKIMNLFFQGKWYSQMNTDLFNYCMTPWKHGNVSMYEDAPNSADFLETNLLSYINNPQKRMLELAPDAIGILIDLYNNGTYYYKGDFDATELKREITPVIIDGIEDHTKLKNLLNNKKIFEVPCVGWTLYKKSYAFIDKIDISKFVEIMEATLLPLAKEPQKWNMLAMLAAGELFDLYNSGVYTYDCAPTERETSKISIDGIKSIDKALALIMNEQWLSCEDGAYFYCDYLTEFIHREDISQEDIIKALYEYHNHPVLKDYFSEKWDLEEVDENILREFSKNNVVWAQEFLNDIQELINEDGEDDFDFNDEDEQDSSDD